MIMINIKTVITRTLLYFCASLLAGTTSHAAANSLSIQRITPRGDSVPAGQQVIIEFNQPVVPLGNMTRRADELPITIKPAVDCHWRWMDTRTLACQLDFQARLAQATYYSITIEPGIKTEAGLEMSKTHKATFTTTRPDLESSWFHNWLSPGLPVMLSSFNMPVHKDSVAEKLYLQVNGQHVAVKVALPPEWNAEHNINKDPDIQSLWLIKPVHELPLDKSVRIMLEPGLLSDTGPVPGKAKQTQWEFHTFADFKFLGMRCYSTSTEKYRLINRSSDIPFCDPQSSLSLSFNSPVSNNTIKEHLGMQPDLANGRYDHDPWAGVESYPQLGQLHYKNQNYEVYIPEKLIAFQSYRIFSNSIVDEFGRQLAEPIELSFKTAHRQPGMSINTPFAVLEQGVDSHLPVYVTNLDEIRLNPYNTLTNEGAVTHQQSTVPLPKIVDVTYAHRLPIRKLLNNKSGVVSATVEMNPDPKNRHHAQIFAEVTPWQVHVKLGHFTSLAWVVDMATGEPVAGAKVTLYLASLSDPAVHDEAIKQTVVTNDQGIAELTGLLELDPELTLIQRWKYSDQRLMVHVEKDQDIAVLPISDAFTIWGNDVHPWTRDQYGYIQTWGTTAQGVYRPGDTIQYKFYVRDQNNQTLIKAPDTVWNLTITDPVNQLIKEIENLQLNEFGAFDGEVLIPEGASVGWYRFTLNAINKDHNRTLFDSEPITVLVSDFTPAAFKVQTILNAEQFKPGDELVITTSARLHAGGPYTGARTSVSADLVAKGFHSTHGVAKDFSFDTRLPDSPDSSPLLQYQEELNDRGDLETRIVLQDVDIIHGTLRVESNVQDDRGKSVANMHSAAYFSRDQLVGLKNTQWVYTQNKEAEVQYMVVDQHGVPVADTLVSLNIERQENKTSRVKSAGNAYVNKYITEWVAAAACAGRSSIDPVACYFTPDQPGRYRITATIKDSKNRPHTSQIYAWVAGQGHVVWEQASNNNLTIIPEDTNPSIGDTVRYLVKNPYPGGKALISIERYGVLKSWVTEFTQSTEIIEFPVEADFMPGYYLSVTVFSPRVEKPLNDGNVDLGKPAFSMGYVSVPVSDPYKQIDVNITSSRKVYEPGEKVELAFSAKPKNSVANKSVELAVVVLDEAVFDLILEGEKYFDPYQGFYSLNSLDVTNYSLLARLIGRQRFEQKGASTGGDGGKSEISFRSIEKYVGYWNPSLVLAAGTTETISFSAPDNLTGWRVFAMAVTKDDRLGLGQMKFTVNKEIELNQVMPNQVMQGDRFQAGFSIMNRTSEARVINVDIKATGSVDNKSVVNTSVTVDSFKRRTIWLPILSTKPGEILVQATATSGAATDGLAHTIPVLKRRILDTSAEYATFTAASATTSILFPKNIHNDAGDLSVTISPTVISNVDGAFKYMRDYPYQCWEQQLTKGVMADHFQSLKNYLATDSGWPESKALPGSILNSAARFQAPSGGMGFWIADDDYVSPYLSAYTALAFGWLKYTSHTIPELVEEKLHTYLLDLLKRDVMPAYYDKGLVSTVRAIALAALAKQNKISLDDLERYHDHVARMSLFGKAHYLLAANSIEGADDIIKDTIDRILSHGVQSAGKLHFNETLSSDYQRILTTPMRTQCAILSALSESANTSARKQQVGDIPFKIVRAITQGRGARSHWANTQENMFCMNALSEYSRAYEVQTPAMTVNATLDNEPLGTTAFTGRRDPALTFTHAINKDDPGRKTTLTIRKQGSGRLYYTTRLHYALLDTEAKRVHSGIEIRREYSIRRNDEWEILTSPMHIKRGELVRVDLFLDLPAARNYVVIDDPVPGGLEPVNRDLATTSVMDAEAGEFAAAAGSFWFEHDDWQNYGYSRWSFYHRELRHEAVRFYADYLSPGNYHLSYTAQAIASGSFSVLPAKSEEMYDPDVYGRSLPARLIVSDQN